MRKILAPLLVPISLLLSSATVQQNSYAQWSVQQDDAYAASRYEGAAKIGGPVADYVQAVARRVAAAAKLPNASTLRVTIMDSNVFNASATNTGIYISRGFLVQLQDEAELASVLGHEIGHVTAGHLRPRPTPVQDVLQRLFGELVGFEIKPYPPEREFEADERGVEYLTAAGYDPAAAIDEYNLLRRHDEYRPKEPDDFWFTHPPSTERLRKVTEQVRSSGKVGEGIRNRDRFLSMIDGLMFGENPQRGLTTPDSFYVHPELRFAFAFPKGSWVRNHDEAVTINPGMWVIDLRKGIAKFSGWKSGGVSLEDHVKHIHGRLYPQSDSELRLQRGVTNGMPTVFLTTTESHYGTAVDVSIVAYQFDRDMMYFFSALTSPGSGIAPLQSMFSSFDRLSSEAASRWIKPYRIRVHTVLPGETVQSLVSRMPRGHENMTEFLFLNNLKATDTLQGGQKVKLVV